MEKIERSINKINRGIVGKDEIKRVIKVLKSGLLSRPAGGPVVREFQELMAKKFEKKYAYATNSGTSALHLAISALGLKEKDEIIIPALANIADCSVVIQEHAKPIFADINSETFNIDPEDIKRKITPNTKAIIAVHMYGEPADINSIKAIAKKNNLVLIEDCAQAAGARYNKRYVGSFGDISCFSFYQTKHVVTGEGGMLLTDSERWLRIINSLANNGIKKDNLDAYDYDRLGYNYQMTEMQAALGIAQLKRLDELNKIRRQNAAIYKEQLKEIDIVFQKTSINTKNARTSGRKKRGIFN
jgi:perosamine synthetase